MAASVSGRSRHGSRTVRTHRSKATKPREDEVPPKPNLDELRRKRLLYLSVSPETRRRIATVAAEPKPSDDLRKTPSDERRRRRRKHRSSSNTDKAEKRETHSRAKSEDFVYGTSIPSSSRTQRRERDRDQTDVRERSHHSVAPRRYSMPTVDETEVTPEDSISQVGVRQVQGASRSRPSSSSSLKRSKTSLARLATITEMGGTVDSQARSKTSRKRDSAPSLLGSLLRRHTAPAVPAPPRLVECLTCAADDVPLSRSAKLACNHRMCHDCLKRIFEMSVKDPVHMPPRCCTDDHIPLKHVDKLFDLRFKMLWNRKYQEYHTRNRIYCPTMKCGEWIRPTHIRTHQGRKYAQCPRCQTKVCTSCNSKMHKSKECPKDPEIAKLVEQAKEKGWQSCYSCHAMVELKEGCNHMTCRCLAEFCMPCGAKWKTCDCPWFNYSQLPDPDHLNEWRIPEPIQVIYRRAFGGVEPGEPAPPPAPPPIESPPALPPDARTGNRRQRTYQQEIDERRRQERLDADLARRLQLATLLEPEEQRQGPPGAEANIWGIGNAGDHFMNDNYVQNAADVVMNAFGNDANIGRRGERSSGRRRRARQSQPGDSGLVSDFLGDASVLNAGHANRTGN